ncbi:MAG TPA: hypothetical protein VKQ36_14950, partial [Ktedonobacterales bacterium]|nr:hypothetical protein [Ktedonobacterales bacterium]
PYLVDALTSFAVPNAQRGRISRFLRRVEATNALVGHYGLWRALALLLLLGLLLNGGRIPGQTRGARPALDARFDAQVFPVAAVARLHATGLPPGRGFNTYEWGGYLEVALPGYHPFIDSRSDSYSERFLHDYLTIITVAPGWPRLLDRYAIAWALLPSGAPLAQLLARIPPWRCRPADAQGVAVLCARSPASIPVLSQAHDSS